MKRNEIKVGREYVVKVGGRYGFTVKETVLEIEERGAQWVYYTLGGYGERCKRVSRNFVRAVEPTPERAMDLLVAFADGMVAPPATPKVVAYTDDALGLPLLKPRAETPAERTKRIYSEAMARS